VSTNYQFSDQDQNITSLEQAGAAIWLQQLGGFFCGFSGTPHGPRATRGLAVLDTDLRRCEDNDFHLIEEHFETNQFRLTWQVQGESLEWTSAWQFDPSTAIWRRRDWLHNTGSQPVTLRRFLARFAFTPAEYQIYTLSSSWSHENQGRWVQLYSGRLTLRSQAGRTNQGASPYLFFRTAESKHGLAFHIIPCGNWVIHIDQTRTPAGETTPFVVVELGLSDDHLHLALAPGETVSFPEILIQATPGQQPESGAAALHTYLLQQRHKDDAILPSTMPAVKPFAPVIYNTWFDVFEKLEPERLKTQLAAAKEIGCEIFTIDAGWYGAGSGDWHRQVGDWREKQEGAFFGKMAAFADQVRAAGLGFGLWMEPERYGEQAPVRLAHPDWFLPGDDGFAYPDLQKPDAYAYVKGEMARLIETYQLTWMKVDFNFELGAAADELAGYSRCWYALLDELRSQYPQLFIEGCASGGMRLDLNTLQHFDGHFLSDTVNPVDVLRISQGAYLRLPPGRITKWAVLRSIGKVIPRYGMPIAETPERVVTPTNSGWEDAVVADLDFCVRAALPGMLGFSGDLASLTPDQRARLRQHIAFYKTWRAWMTGAVCHLLTPNVNLDQPSGWVGFQLQQPGDPSRSMVLVYRLKDGASHRWLPLHGLDEKRQYQITDVDQPARPPETLSGRQLLTTGLAVQRDALFSAGIYLLESVE
jgi:alpha-galactosidase